MEGPLVGELGLGQTVLEFLQAAGCLERLELARAQSGTELLSQPFLLEVDVLELAACHPDLGQAFYDDAEGFRQLVYSQLVAIGKLHAAERLWVRPSGLVAESCSCVDALGLLRCHPICTVAIHGVCCAATAIFQQRYSRTFVCGCGMEMVVREGEECPTCCGPAFIKENLSRATTMQVQVIYLAQESSAGRATQLGEPTIAVHLNDDLCGKARIGDQLLVVGMGRHVHTIDASSATHGCRPAVQVDAVGLEVLPAQGPTIRCKPSLQVQRPPAILAQSGLEGLLGALGCCFDAPCGPLVRLALLLSAAAVGLQPVEGTNGDWAEDDEAESFVQRRACAQSRAQVNLLLQTRGTEPHLQRLLQQAAAGLCQQSVVGSPNAKQLLPHLFAKYVEPRLQLQVPLAMGGQVAEANSGVLLLSSSQLGAKQGAALATCLRVGTVPLMANVPELAVRLTPTVWCLAQDQDLGKPSGKAGCSSKQQGHGVVSARLAAKYGGHFLAQFDILLDCSSDDMEDLDLWAEQLLSSAQMQQQAVHVACARAGSGEHEAVAQVERNALAAFQAHLRRAVALPHPHMTQDAMALLGAYFALIRVAEESPQGVLESMVRVATACARLCHRCQVLAFPDSMVAIMFMEEQILTRGGYANQWAKWRKELNRGTELGVCLEGLHGTLQDCFATTFMDAEE